MAEIQSTTAYGMRLQFRGHNAADWPSDYVLLAGEVGFELDTKKYKLGDGVKTWTQLEYYSDPTISAAVEALTQRVSTNEGNIADLQGRMSTAEGTIATHTTDIATNAGNIATNTTNIATNTADIATNAGNIATNTADIATNAGNIATNTADISLLKGINVISGNPAPAAQG